MDILILGAGAIGSLYGAKLSERNNVILVARQRHAEIINKKGLTVMGLEKKNIKIKSVAKISEIKKNTLLLLTTKVYDSADAVNSIKHIVKKDTIILCLQNGLGSEDIVRGIILNKCIVLRGITNFGASFIEPGVVSYNSRGYTAIEKSGKSSEIAGHFNKCGLECCVSDNIKKDVWKKLVLNCVLNPLTAILKVENGKIADKRLDALKGTIIDECLKVASKEGIRFDFDFLKMINKVLKNSTNISSMMQDIIKGRRTEIGCLNASVAELGQKHGIECPVNKGLASIIRQMEENSLKNPQKTANYLSKLSLKYLKNQEKVIKWQK